MKHYTVWLLSIKDHNQIASKYIYDDQLISHFQEKKSNHYIRVIKQEKKIKLYRI